MPMLMEGITIINQTEIMSAPEWMIKTATYSLFFAFIIIIIGSVFAGFYKFYYYNKVLKNLCIFTIILAITSAAFTFIFAIFSMLKPMQTVPTGKYRYEVTVDDNITYKNYKEFTEKYEIIEEKENSLIVEEKGES